MAVMHAKEAEKCGGDVFYVKSVPVGDDQLTFLRTTVNSLSSSGAR